MSLETTITSMPDLALIDPAGQTFTLRSVQGERTAIVYFLRAADCPICVRHARTLARLAEANRLRGAAVLLVAPGGDLVAPGGGDKSAAARLADRVPSPAVSTWASGTAHAAAGLGTFLSVQHSGTFVLDPDGTIRYRRTAALPPRSFDEAELHDALEHRR